MARITEYLGWRIFSLTIWWGAAAITLNEAIHNHMLGHSVVGVGLIFFGIAGFFWPKDWRTTNPYTLEEHTAVEPRWPALAAAGLGAVCFLVGIALGAALGV